MRWSAVLCRRPSDLGIQYNLLETKEHMRAMTPSLSGPATAPVRMRLSQPGDNLVSRPVSAAAGNLYRPRRGWAATQARRQALVADSSSQPSRSGQRANAPQQAGGNQPQQSQEPLFGQSQEPAQQQGPMLPPQSLGLEGGQEAAGRQLASPGAQPTSGLVSEAVAQENLRRNLAQIQSEAESRPTTSSAGSPKNEPGPRPDSGLERVSELAPSSSSLGESPERLSQSG
jgi:hypothetical protein